MKAGEIIGYGLLAYLGYKFIIKPHQAVPVATTMPVMPSNAAVLPQGSSTSPVTAITETVGTLFKQLFPSAPAPANNGSTTNQGQPTTDFPGTVNKIFPITQFPPVPGIQTSFTGSNAGVVQEDTSNLFTSNSPFTSDTAYFQSLEEDELAV